ncbi:MAG TPA: potassium channel family protein, partial [Thermoplasmata archaeon]|nr:potassium channel family protein [Thermoplasmata archaeon]
MRSPRVSYFGRLFGRLWKFLLGYVVVVLVATFGFYFLEDGSFNLLTSLYWAMITLSTIGYGDVVPNTSFARAFTIGIAATEVFLGAYLVSVIITGVQEEAQHRALGTLGTNFSGHIVVVGTGAVGRAAIRELLAQEEKVAIVTTEADEVANLRLLSDDKHLFVTYGGAADPEILRRVNIPGAHSVIVCTDDDTQNLVVTLNVRELNPSVRVVVSVSRPELRHTLRSAGVTYVASPGDMGGRV